MANIFIAKINKPFFVLTFLLQDDIIKDISLIQDRENAQKTDSYSAGACEKCEIDCFYFITLIGKKQV